MCATQTGFVRSWGRWYHVQDVAPKLLIASNNPGKIQEYREVLKGLPFELTWPSNEGLEGEPEETGVTFEENALLKARAFADMGGLLTIADDSGLEVDALGGEPGVRSARYAGASATDEQRVQLVLSKIADVPWEARTARFRCVLAVVFPGGAAETFSGAVEGYIATASQGDNGFGYDPVFYLPELGMTFAQLEPQAKNRLSHRAAATAKLVERLKARAGETMAI